MGARAKERPAIEVDVPRELAAEFIAKHMDNPSKDRPLLELRLGEYDLGLWRIAAVRTEWTDSGYEVAVATLRAMWP